MEARIKLPSKISSITVDGFSICGYTDTEMNSGMTLLLCKRPNTAGIFKSGGALATHETDLLKSTHRSDYSIDGIFLTGRSVFGLGIISGIYEWMKNNMKGLKLDGNYIPIVPGAAIYDLSENDQIPGTSWAINALKSIGNDIPIGPYWSGTGATVSKYKEDRKIRSGQGYYEISRGNIKVGVVVILNSLGDIYNFDGKNITGSEPKSLKELSYRMDNGNIWQIFTRKLGFNTTIGAVITNAIISNSEADYIAESANFGFASRIWPYSTSLDGDTVFCVSSNKYEESVDSVAEMARMAAEMSVLSIFE